MRLCDPARAQHVFGCCHDRRCKTRTDPFRRNIKLVQLVALDANETVRMGRHVTIRHAVRNALTETVWIAKFDQGGRHNTSVANQPPRVPKLCRGIDLAHPDRVQRNRVRLRRHLLRCHAQIWRRNRGIPPSRARPGFAAIHVDVRARLRPHHKLRENYQ